MKIKASIVGIAFFASLLSGTSFAQDKPINIQMSYSAELEKAFQENYGIREKEIIESLVKEELSKSFANSNYKFEITLNNVAPNRPTIEQMSNKPGLSYESFSIGGADVSGKIYDASGNLIAQTKYEYTNPYIFDARYNWTWHDAEWALKRFVRKLSKEVK